jgi:hypothetical protein
MNGDNPRPSSPPSQFNPVATPACAEPATRAKRRNRAVVVSLCVIVPLGFYTKFYSGPAPGWVRNSLGGVFYELFWCLLAAWLFPRTKPGTIAVTVLLITCVLEFLQLWHPGFLQLLRGHFIGQAILGDYFAWSDFPYYIVGSGLAWFWMKRLHGRSKTLAEA